MFLYLEYFHLSCWVKKVFLSGNTTLTKMFVILDEIFAFFDIGNKK